MTRPSASWTSGTSPPRLSISPPRLEADETGQSNALLGLAHYQSEDYAAAAVQYRRAVDRDPQRRDWRHMLAASRRNAEAEVNVYVPEVQFFDRDRLLAHPVDPALPEPGSDGSSQSIARRVRYVVGHAVGSVAGVVFDGLVTVIGPHYRGEVWTNWYRKRLYRGILTLAYMREKLDRDNLMSTYPTGSRVAFLPDGLEPPAGVTHYRTADGSWNNLADPKEGAAGTRFPRNVANAAITPEAGDRLLTPNPRAVSRTLLTRGDTMAEVPFLNLLAASWIQFQNHDWINHGENVTNELHRGAASRRRPGPGAVPSVDDVRRLARSRTRRASPPARRRRSPSSTR